MTTGAITRAKLSQIVTSNKLAPNFLNAECISCHPANCVKAFKGNNALNIKRIITLRHCYVIMSTAVDTKCHFLNDVKVAAQAVMI